MLKRAASHELIPVVVLCLFAAWAFLARPSLPRETDAELHVLRTAELAYALRAGDLYPRWAADFYYGYGYPIYNYYAPLTYYLANVFTLATPTAAVFGVKAVFVLGYLLGGVGTYQMVRRTHEVPAGLLAAACYLFAPYVFLINPHMRGVLAEFFALGIGPFAFWLTARHIDDPSRGSLLAAALATTALILAHNLLALVTFGLLAGYVAWRLAVMRDGRPVISGLPLVFGLLLSAFFWLNVALEGDAVQLGNLIGPGHFDFRNHFLSAGELFAPSLPLDLGALNPAFRFNLGVAQWVLAAIGAAAAIRLRRLESGYFALAGTVLIALMLPLSLPIWEGLPFLAFIQFPWRLLGPTAFCLAILAAGALDWLPKENAWLRAAPLALPLLLALPVFVPPGWGDFGPTDRLAMLNFELNGLALGTTSTGDFVPAGVDVVPGPQPTMIAAYEQGGPVDRVNRATLPPGATVDLLGQRTISHRYRVTSSEDFTLRLYLFDFAGWRASIDGQPVPIETASPEGWITVPVPAGSHEVRVWLGTTPARTLTTLISVAGAAGLAFAAWRLPASARSERAAPGNRAQAAAVLSGTMLLMAISGAAGWFQVRSTGVVAEPAEVDTRAYLEGGLDLIGYAIGQQTVRPGESLPVTLYWKAREPVPANYQVFVHLTTSADTTWAQSDKLNPGDYPTTRWPLDRYLRDPHAVAIPTGTPPGTYQLRIGLWLRDSGRRNLVLAEDGTILGDTVLLAMPVTVEPARGPVDVPVPAIRVDSEIQPGIRLVGANLTPGTSFDAPLGQLAVDLVWLSNRGDLPAYGTWLRLVAPDGTVVAQAHRSTDEKQYPTPLWTDGEVVREVMGLWIGEDVTPGTYRLEVALSEDTPSAWHPVTLIERSLP